MAIIREYKPEDREGIEACLFELQEEEHQRAPEYWETAEKATKPYYDYLVNSLKSQPGNIFVAEEDGNIKGMVAVRIETEDSPCVSVKRYSYISDIAVRKDFRGGGTGKKLMEQAERFARENGVPFIELHAMKNNSALEFYRHLGYTKNDRFVRMNKKLNE